MVRISLCLTWAPSSCISVIHFSGIYWITNWISYRRSHLVILSINGSWIELNLNRPWKAKGVKNTIMVHQLQGHLALTLYSRYYCCNIRNSVLHQGWTERLSCLGRARLLLSRDRKMQPELHSSVRTQTEVTPDDITMKSSRLISHTLQTLMQSHWRCFTTVIAGRVSESDTVGIYPYTVVHNSKIKLEVGTWCWFNMYGVVLSRRSKRTYMCSVGGIPL